MKLLKNPLLLMFLMVLSPRLLPAQTTESYTFTTNRLVPDGNLSGLIDGEYVSSAIGAISSVQVRLKVTGEFNGDLYAYLRNTNGFVVLLNRGGATTSNPSGYGDSGFNVTFQAAAANGDIHVYQNVTNPAAGSPLAGFWQPDGRTNDPATVTDLSPRTTSLTNFNGFNAAGTWTLYLADLQSGGTNMLTQWGLDISGAASPTLTWTNPAGITYGTALSLTQLNATATYGSTNVPGTFTYSSPAGTVLDVATNQTLSVMFTPHDTNSFLPVTANVTINVSPAPLIITANNTNNVYGAALPAFTASYSGFVNGDTAASLSTPVTLGTSAAASSPVGAYPITASGAAATNYTINYVNGMLSVSAATLTITAANETKAYGQALPELAATYAGFVNGDTTKSLTSVAILTTTANAGSGVGVYPITATDAVSSNYLFTYIAGSLSITNSLTSGALVSSANPSPTGSNVTFTATVAAVAPGAGTPTGTINFRIDGAVLAASVLSAGVATLTANNLTHGYHTVVAEYAGDSNFTGTTNSLTPNQLINTPPVAGNVTLYRNPVLGVKVQLATLLTNASSPDGDTLALSVSSTSASNATITVSGHWAFYTPPAGFTNADSFTYKVTDTYGGSATGTVTVAILVDNSQSQNLVITNPGSGGVLISGNGVPGYQYRLQYSVVPGPAYFWQTLTNVTADGTGKFEYTDTSGDLTRFYRTAYP